MTPLKVLPDAPTTGLNLDLTIAQQVNVICESVGVNDDPIRHFLVDVILESVYHRADEWHSKGIDPDRAPTEEIVNAFRPSLKLVLDTAIAIARAKERSVLLIDVLSSMSVHACSIWPLCTPLPVTGIHT